MQPLELLDDPPTAPEEIRAMHGTQAETKINCCGRLASPAPPVTACCLCWKKQTIRLTQGRAMINPAGVANVQRWQEPESTRLADHVLPPVGHKEGKMTEEELRREIAVALLTLPTEQVLKQDQ